MIVARTSNVAAAKLLLDHGAHVNAKETQKEQTALMWAAAESQPAMVKELIAHGADVNAREHGQRRPGAGQLGAARQIPFLRRIDAADLCRPRRLRLRAS